MDQLQLYINDLLVDLSEDSPIVLSFQINNLADVRNQQGNTSNQFKIPLTQRNRQILGFPDNVAFASTLPYSKYDAKVIQDGLEIIPYGIAELNSVDQDNASITILSGNVDFFDLIDGKIYDMGDSNSQWSNYGKNLVWQPYDHKWNLSNVVNSQTKTDGWIWPVVDYGLTQDTIDAAIIDVRHMRPGFFIKTAIDLLLKSTGYKGTGSLFSDPLYPLLICQFSNSTFEHGTDYQSNIGYKSMAAELGQHFTAHNIRDTDINRRGNIPFSIITDPDKTTIGRPDDSYYADELIKVNASFTYSLTFRSTNPSHADYSTKLNIQLRVIDSNTGLNHLITQQVFNFADRGDGPAIIANKQTLSADDLILNPGQRLKVFYEFDGYTGGSFSIVKGAKFTVTNKISEMQLGQDVQCERIFPDISQKDLLKDTLQRFGIICQTDNTARIVSFNSFRDIVNNIPIAKNWTNKCVDQGKQITFQLGNYSQVNYLQYKEDENVLPAKFGWSQINIKDQTLPASSTLFESVFSPTHNRPFYGRSIAQIKMVDSTDGGTDFNISVEPRILIDQKVDLRDSGKTITFTDGIGNAVVNDYISTPYFYKPDAPDLPNGYGKGSLLFDDLRKKYYSELEEILTETKKVVRYILLNPRDILELDLLIPIYLEQDSTYYYINKIDSWRKGQSTKVELVKLG